MRFDEAFGHLVKYCSERASSQAAISSQRSALRVNSGDDISISEVAAKYLTSGSQLSDADWATFYDAAWELCRIGVLRPGHYAPKGMAYGNPFSGDQYSITDLGAKWLTDSASRISGDPSRMAEQFGNFAQDFGTGFVQRAIEAVSCHRNGNYLASCAMAGAAGESILLAVAIEKTQDESKVLSDYGKGQGRLLVTRLVTTSLPAGLKAQLEAPFGVLKYWRDNAAHGKAVTISEVEAFAALSHLLRLAQFTRDNWSALTS